MIGTFTQYPVKLAWAITIHKSQGLTFDHVVIDLGAGAFVNGQVYTALSRCRKLNGIVLKRTLRPEDLITDKRIIEFHRKNSPQCIDDLLNLDIPFAIRLLSLYYPFSAAQIDQYWDELEKGDAHYSVFINETGTMHTPATGLCFNRNLDWTDQLRSRWNAGLVNPLTGSMKGIGSAPAGTASSDLSKPMLPLNLKKELKFRNKAINEHWCAVIAPKQDWESDAAFEEPKLLPMEKFGKEFERLDFEAFRQLYETDKTLLLFNDSIWRNTLKELMPKERVHELLTISISANL